MDVERCVVLHNEILQHGWIGSGRSPDQLAANCTHWFDYYGAKAEAVRPSLDPDLIIFLERALLPNVEEFSFFYWVNSLAGPDYMFEFECLSLMGVWQMRKMQRNGGKDSWCFMR
jgi:hypothetical protein